MDHRTPYNPRPRSMVLCFLAGLASVCGQNTAAERYVTELLTMLIPPRPST